MILKMFTGVLAALAVPFRRRRRRAASARPKFYTASLGTNVEIRYCELVGLTKCSRLARSAWPHSANLDGSLDLSAAHDIVKGWPRWKQDLAKRTLRPSQPPATVRKVSDDK